MTTGRVSNSPCVHMVLTISSGLVLKDHYQGCHRCLVHAVAWHRTSIFRAERLLSSTAIDSHSGKPLLLVSILASWFAPSPAFSVWGRRGEAGAGAMSRCWRTPGSASSQPRAERRSLTWSSPASRSAGAHRGQGQSTSVWRIPRGSTGNASWPAAVAAARPVVEKRRDILEVLFWKSSATLPATPTAARTR